MTTGSPEPPTGSQAAPLRPSDPVGLGVYTLLGRLGQGGMGTVYLGRAPQGRLVAIKVIRADVADDPEFRSRFRREADNARRVARFCTAEVLDADPDADAPYLVTEFIEGETLAKSIATKGPLSEGNLERLALGVASGIAAVHAAGIIHRDLKPSNVVLSSGGPRVIDFGIARSEDSTTHLTGDLQQLGTPAFMAPEQIEGRAVSPKVDVFAWGGVVAYAGTGRQVFGEGPVTALLYRAVHDEPDLGNLAEPLRSIVASALEKNPARRPSAQELVLRLLGQPASAPVSVQEAGPAVTQVLSGWKVPETPPGGVPQQGRGGVGTPDWVGTGRGTTSTPGTGRPGTGTPGRRTSPIPHDEAMTERVAADQVPGYPQPGYQQPGYQQPGYGQPGYRQPGGVPPAPRKKTRWPIVAGVAAVVVALAVIIPIALSGGGGSGSGGSTGLSTTAAKDAIVLPKAAQPLSKDDYVYASQGKFASIIFTAPADGSGQPKTLVSLAIGLNLLPILSPDRKTVVYFLPSKTGRQTLRALASDGSTARVDPFVTGQAATLQLAKDARPTFSPDGRKLAVVAAQGPRGAGLYLVSFKDASVLKIATPAGLTTISDPAISPDGKTVVYWAGSSSEGGELFVSPTDGTGVPTSIVDGINADPSWSPDGNTIVYRTDDDPGNVNRDIDVTDPSGKTPTRLTTDPASDQDPSFSPDGTKIIFSSERQAGLRQIYEMNANGSNQHPIRPNDGAKDSAPGWQYH